MKQSTSVVHKKSFNTLANQITILRIIMIPAIVITLLQGQLAWVIGLLSFSILTDFLDGLAARLRGEQTTVGAFLDPVADKLLLTAVYLTLTYLGLIPIWLFVVVFSRDLIIVLGWGVIFILTGSSKTVPRLLGKITTAVQLVTALASIMNAPTALYQTLLWSTVGFTIISTLDYVIVGEKRLGEWG